MMTQNEKERFKEEEKEEEEEEGEELAYEAKTKNTLSDEI